MAAHTYWEQARHLQLLDSPELGGQHASLTHCSNVQQKEPWIQIGQLQANSALQRTILCLNLPAVRLLPI